MALTYFSNVQAAIVNVGDESCYLTQGTTTADCTIRSNGTHGYRYAPDSEYAKLRP